MVRVLLVSILFVTVPSFAQNTLLQRVDLSPNRGPYAVTAVITPDIELWAFGWQNKQEVDLEVGRLVPIGNFLVGGYAVAWPDSGKYFAMPWVTYTGKLGNAEAVANLSMYLPINGGPTIFYSSEIAVRWPVNRHLSAGVAASFWEQDSGPMPLQFGPSLRFSSGSTAIKWNWEPFATSGKASQRHQIEVSRKF